MKTMIALAPAIALMFWLPAPLLNATDTAGQGHGAPVVEVQVHQGRGTVEVVDAVKGTVTLEHEPIASLRWPKMVMDFKVTPPALLENIKEGDSVTFDFTVQGKDYTITRIDAEQ